MQVKTLTSRPKTSTEGCYSDRVCSRSINLLPRSRFHVVSTADDASSPPPITRFPSEDSHAWDDLGSLTFLLRLLDHVHCLFLGDSLNRLVGVEVSDLVFQWRNPQWKCSLHLAQAIVRVCKKISSSSCSDVTASTSILLIEAPDSVNSSSKAAFS